MGIYEEKKAELARLRDKFADFDGYGQNLERFNEFFENGSRLNYENEYFARRGCLMARGADAIINGNGEADGELYKIINAVCAEFTWTLPAHLDRDTKEPEKVIDLFSAETAQTLCEIKHYARLDAKTREKIRSLVYERIIEPFESGAFWWEKSTHNWAAVCSGCVGMVYMYEFPERFGAVRERILKTMERFLSGYGADGVCLEGLRYWEYGFGYFTYFSEFLRRFDGTDLLAGEKPPAISDFYSRMFLDGNATVSFSDGSRNGTFNIGLACFLKKEYGAKIPAPSRRADYDACYRFAPYLRSFLWLDEAACAGENDCGGEKYFSDAQWYISRHEKFAFAAKGGSNGEPHNHNDVGCFIISGGGEQLICDLGAGEYTREYFRDESRYGYFCASSRGHSVPIIDGEYQKNGEMYGASVIKAQNGVFELDISGAYEAGRAVYFRRKFEIAEDKITLRDSFDVSGKRVVERLVSLIKPANSNGDTKIKNMLIRSDTVPEINAVTFKNHSGADETVYTIDYEAKPEEFKLEFIFS